MELNPTDEVLVDFYNPIGDPKALVYLNDTRPESFDPSNDGQVINFYGEVGVHNASIEASEVESNSIEKEMNQTIRVFANNGLLQVKSANNDPIFVEIISLTGKRLKRSVVEGNGTINLLELPKGMYLVQTINQANNHSQVIKVVF